MKKLFKLLAYRIASFNKRAHLSYDYVAQSYFLLFFSITCYVLTIIHVVLSQFGIKLYKAIIIVICIPLLIEIVRFDELFPNAQVEFDNFEKRLIGEKRKRFKEVLVILFLFMSWISCLFILLK